MSTKLLLIYTGGTIGMIKDPDTGALRAFNFDELLLHIQELKHVNCSIETISFEEPIDSSDIEVEHWQRMADIIGDDYASYDGFVILHGSDTMSYTGSALSFMLDHLDKPVIITGSQLPIGDLRTDAKENLITSIQLAAEQYLGKPAVKEVCIYFEYQLYRANRTAKLNAEHFEAFSSPNYPPLAISGVHLKIHRSRLWTPLHIPQDIHDNNKHTFRVRKELDTKVAVLRLFPGIQPFVVEALTTSKDLKGLIIETYGSGNALTRKWFLNSIRRCIDRGVRVVNVTQCIGGSVDMGKYATSTALKSMGVISGKDMTTEAAVTKMMYLLSYVKEAEEFGLLYEQSLRGELSD